MPEVVHSVPFNVSILTIACQLLVYMCVVPDSCRLESRFGIGKCFNILPGLSASGLGDLLLLLK
jgi:hypothetical protein